MTVRPKVSVCVPTYNQTKYLRGTLDSIVAQRYEDYEVVLSDDSNTEDVMHLVDGYASRLGQRLRYIRNRPSLGTPENWNAAIQQARGKYIKLMHHDDFFVNEESLEKFVNMLDDRPDADFAFSATLVTAVKSGKSWVHPPKSMWIPQLSNEPSTLLLGNMIGAPSATIHRRELTEDYDRNLKWLVDIEFYIRILKKNPNFVFEPQPLICTPTAVEHQVTETCKTNKNVELVEYAYVLEKHRVDVTSNPAYLKAFSALFWRYHVSSADELRSHVQYSEDYDRFYREAIKFRFLAPMRHAVHRLVGPLWRRHDI